MIFGFISTTLETLKRFINKKTTIFHYNKSLDDNYDRFDFDSSQLNLDSDEQLKYEQDQLSIRDRGYTVLLKQYVRQYYKDQKLKPKMQIIFFFAMLAMAFLILILTYKLILSFKDDSVDHIQLVQVVFSSIAGVVSSVIVIPHTIAKYLFNPKEIEIISNVITEMHKQDIANKALLNQTNNKKNQKKAQQK